MTPARLVLWDVDHTLIATGGVGTDVFRDAFQAATGQVMRQQAEVAGRTEPAIFAETLELHGLDPSRELFEDFAEYQADGYEQRADELCRRGQVLPGAAEALAAFADMPQVAQSVLTGNTRAGAQTKLAIFGLAKYLDLDAGAYGTDDSVRGRLVPIARRRAATRYGTEFDGQAAILIGDTPNDVAAGLDGHARVIAVASGKSTVDNLATAGAHVVLPDLTDLRTLAEAITS